MLEMKNFLFYFFIVWTENTIKMYGNQNCLVTNNLQILILWAMKCIQVCDDKSLKWWQNFYFWMYCPFKIWVYLIENINIYGFLKTYFLLQKTKHGR